MYDVTVMFYTADSLSHLFAGSSFSIANSVRQGGILSLFISPLYSYLIGSISLRLALGRNVASTMINLLCFADDMVLLAPSWSGLQILIDKLHRRRQWQLI